MTTTFTGYPDMDAASLEGVPRLGVAMLIHRFHPHVGGAETQLKGLAPHLIERGIGVHVVTRMETGTVRSEVIDGARVIRTPVNDARLGASLSYSQHALNYLWRNRSHIQLIHAHGLLSPSTTAVLAKVLLRVPVVVTAHGFQADLKLLRDGPLGAQRFALIGRTVDRFVVISDEIRSGLLEQGIDPTKLAPVRNGIDTERFIPAAAEKRQELRSELEVSHRRVVLYVGRLEKVKGADVLLDAWPSVLREVPDAELLIAGDGAERVGLERRGVPNVRFLGARHDPLPLYQAADCYVLPSISEGLPVALLEALSTGLPVVSTAVGGAIEILDGCASTMLVPPGDPAALGRDIVAQLQNPPTRAIADGLRQRMQVNYSIDSTADRLATLYRSLVAARTHA